ncbi:ATP-binding protein [candidate division KSB1 bacterium]
MPEKKKKEYSSLSSEQLHMRISELESELEDMNNIQRQLIQTEKLAALGGLVSGVAHEINNPLAIISGYSELLLGDETLSNAQQKKIRKIFDSGARCAKIIRNLLGFARETEIVSEELNVNLVIDNAIAIREYELSVNNININRNYNENLPKIAGDPQMLQQVFINFINNSYDAMFEANEGGTLTINTLKNGKNITVEIIDNGPGVSEDIKSKLFDPFFTTKPPGKGTGLGLSLSFGIIEEHGGTIVLDQKYTGGAKFVIELPLPAVQQKDEDKTSQTAGSAAAAPKALVVDDEIEIVNLMEELFALKNIDIDVANSGEEALVLLAKNKYSMAVLDIRMPGSIDGMKLYQRIKNAHSYLLDSIIFVTGDTTSEDIKSFIEENHVEYILKPFQIQDFTKYIDKYLDTP